MSKVFKRGPTTPEMNMTPLIDVTFQLIIFFMLVNNIVAEHTVTMIVPQLHNARTRDTGEMKSITINVKPVEYTNDGRDIENPPNWEENAIGVKVGSLDFELFDAEGITATLADAVATAPVGEDGKSVLEVILRADAAIRYDEVQPVMAAITAAKIGTIHLAAYKPGEGPGAEDVPLAAE